MFGKKKELTPMVFVIKSDELDTVLIKKIQQQLKDAFPDKRIAVVGLATDEDMYAITG
jgi:hypothetical protein